MQWKWLAAVALAALFLAQSPLLAQTGGSIGGGGPVAVPEISPGSMASALTLLTGGILLVRSRLRRR